jgi:hypothetical protein
MTPVLFSHSLGQKIALTLTLTQVYRHNVMIVISVTYDEWLQSMAKNRVIICMIRTPF